MNIEQTFQLALRHHQSRRMAEAEALYRQILAADSRHAGALHFLGIIAHQVGRNDAAESLIRQAIASNPNLPDAFSNLGTVLKELGRLDEAIAACRQAIALSPGYPDAHINLGNALKNKGQLDEAIAAYRGAIALKPDFALAYRNLGNALKENGQLDEAIATYRRAIALQPNYAEAHYNLSNALRERGQLDEAIAACGQAIALSPNYPDAQLNLGNLLKSKGQLDEAIAALRHAVVLQPADPKAHSNLGNALCDQGLLDEAIAAHREAISLKPDYPEAHYNLGTALNDKGQLDEAVEAYRQAIALTANFPAAHNNLGIVLNERGQLDEAVAAFRQAIVLKPDFPDAHNNLGFALKDKGCLEEAIEAGQRAVALRPNYPQAHFNLGIMLLVQGNFTDGWREYEWRWRTRDFIPSQRDFSQPQWDGRPLEGRTLLLHAEQGFGDTLQFIRYLPLVAQRGARLVVECQEALQRLLQTMSADWTVVARGRPLPAFDVQCPLLSLPHLFATDQANIPQDVPYLHADAAEADVWRERLAGHTSSLKVGLVWAGSPTHRNDRNRSMKLASLTPLARVPGVRFVSLQKGEAAAEAKSPPEGMELLDAGPELKDFADSAALIATLDLVIAVDTSVVHLAGALGKPVWVLLPFAPDWRWLLNRDDSPWYPTMRLFRQQRRTEWESVVATIREELQALVEIRRSKLLG